MTKAFDNTPSIRIDALNLNLPEGFENRADAIGRQIAAALAEMPVTAGAAFDRLAPPPISAAPGESDRVIATRIAHAIHMTIHTAIAGAGNQNQGRG